MAEQEMLLDTATIKAAVAGELWAKEKVVEHYTPMQSAGRGGCMPLRPALCLLFKL